MQSRGARIGVIVIAIAVVVVLFVVLRDDDGDSEPATSTTPATEQPAETQNGGEKDKPKPKPEPEVLVTEIEVKGAQPVGGVKEIKIPSGEEAKIVVSTPDTTDHVHLHGYDVISDLAPGKPATIEFEADIDGVFEMELEESVVPIAEVTVSS